MNRVQSFVRPRLVMGVILASASAAPAGTAVVGDLFFDTFRVSNPLTQQVIADATVQRIHFSYDGGTSYSLGTPSLVKDLGQSGDADGLMFLPGGDLLIGGSLTHELIRITTGGTIVGTATAGNTDPYHVTLGPDQKTIYSGGSTGTIFGIPVVGDNPGPVGVTPVFSNGSAHAPTGSEAGIGITQIAFDAAGNAFYTSSPDTGVGSFGTINLSTFATSRKLSNLPAAHGIVYDPFSKDFILCGNSHITQVDPATDQVVSDLDLSGKGLVMLDNVTVDGHGHVFVGDNGDATNSTKGSIVFLDYSASKLVNSPKNFVNATPVAVALDDQVSLANSLLPGDANFDGHVNFADLLIVAQHYGQKSGQTYFTGDFNNDSGVGFDDLLILAQHYGQSAATDAGATAVPEPAALGLLLSAGLMLARRRRRQ